jgi:adenine phosphoribosyltransferase
VSLDLLRASLKGAPVVRFDDYDYFVHPITDGVPAGDPALFEEVIDALAALGDWACDKIVTAESMGFPLAAALSVKVGKPYLFIRKRRYGLPGEVAVQQVTGYAKGELYVNGVEPGDRVAFVDDVLSTGGTVRACVEALRSAGAVVTEALVVFDKMPDRAALEERLGLAIKTLLRVEVRDGRVVEV